ncbi:MAG: inositol monophosphatase [Candidatus Lambdaproteobacteria bacterium RIFOXYD12_FULL_49_8]|nr:MAG: inositol monophosphatase [Candidatus Lambdaproteobacteria bacterium RIFOXYD12_FULL_49_8]
MSQPTLAEITPIIKKAGALALKGCRSLNQLQVTEKAPRDLVTEIDLQVEQFLIKALSKLDKSIGFFGEETGQSSSQERRWIIDPIDGTHSFVRGQYFWAISLGLEIEGTLRLGAVYAPKLKDLYLGELGKGATKNGLPIQASKVARLDQAMVSTGFACLRAGLENHNLPRFSRIAQATMGQRRFGSAALDICLCADGQVDAFWEQELNLYDIAGGVVIAKEAGCRVTNFAGEEVLNPKEVLVTNGLLTKPLVTLM